MMPQNEELMVENTELKLKAEDRAIKFRCHFQGPQELQDHSPFCLSTEENSVRGKVIDKK